MRRTTITVLALALPLALPASAWAPDHRETVNEILLSTGGNASAQFVELRDTVGEPFPGPPYRLASYDSAGMPVASVTLPSLELAGAGTNPYLVSTPAADAAFGVSADEPLPAGFLPPTGGMVCFEQGMGTRQIACVAYGCPATTGASLVVAPADGQSLQRQTNGAYALAGPTPKATNASGKDAACTGGGGAPDTVAPDQFLAFTPKQDVDKLAITLALNEAASVAVKGSVNVPGAARRLKIKTVKQELAANVKQKFRLRLRRTALRAVRNALEDGKRLKAAVQITAEDAAGNGSTKTQKIKLKD